MPFAQSSAGRCLAALVVFAVSPVPIRADEGGWIDLLATDFEAWKGPAGDWLIAGDAGLDPQNPKRLAAKPGTGVIVNGQTGKAKDLVSKQTFGDLECHVEFLVAKGSNSGVKFEGLYEIQIYDSWGVREPKGSDCGGVYPRAEQTPKYHHIDDGIPPRTNACLPPGEWQMLDAIFLAPRFDAGGKKTANARLVKVVLNGKVIHDNVELATPTGHAWRDKEIPSGPLLLQGDHGPVAFRNVRVRPCSADPKKDQR
jgi:hypothetical protein